MSKDQITVRVGFAWWVKPALVALQKAAVLVVPILGADRTIKIAEWLVSKGARVEAP